jgi:hypothetical protein
LLALFCEKVSLPAAAVRGLSIALQEHHDQGITDIEFLGGDGLLAVLEAKIGGWPGREQLSRYARRLKGQGTGRSVLVPLGVPPFSRTLSEIQKLCGIPVVPLRWTEVLTLVGLALRPEESDEQRALAQLAMFIQEVIGMQSYNREVLVRDLSFEHASFRLFMDFDMYTCQPNEIAEPLFFAPCFTSARTRAGNGIHYVSRVYFRKVVALKNQEAVAGALEDAERVVAEKASALEGRKRARQQVSYLESLPVKWRAGWRYLRKEGWRDTSAVFFLGDPMRLPMPLKKQGKQVPIGFSMTMEQLMSAEPGTFLC